MYCRKLQVILSSLALSFVLTACGNEANEEPVAIEIGLSESALVAGVGYVRLAGFNSFGVSCLTVRSYFQRPDAFVFGEDIALDDVGRQMGGAQTFNVIPEGTYIVAAYGFADQDSTDDVLAFGCQADVSVELGKLTQVDLDLR
ncbi:MAG: hypothetical protein VYC39_17065 [Myxococcota bacterium]|nr:hypothetical protein [Myxococcota bacterium]